MSLFQIDYVIFLPPSLPLVPVLLMALHSSLLLSELIAWQHFLITFIDKLPATVRCAGIGVCRDAFVFWDFGDAA